MDSFEPAHIPLRVQPGATLGRTYRFGSKVKIYKPISAVPQRAPVRLSVVGHQVPDGWPVLVSDVQGMAELNRGEPNCLKPEDFYTATFVDEDTIELNAVNASSFGAYRSGGILTYFTPADLSGMTAKATFFDSSGKQVLQVTSAGGGVVINPSSFTIVLVLTDAQTLTLGQAKQGNYTLDLTTGDGSVIRLAVGAFNTGC